MKYRMYIDEVGNADLGASTNPNHRYLGLTGVILELMYVANVVSPRIEDLKKRYFGSHPDDPIVLHRREMIEKKPPFAALKDPVTCKRFDDELLALVTDLDFMLVTVVIDKQEHLQRYKEWSNEPYHYCLEVLLERFTLMLTSKGARGDVMAESRGKREDQELRRVYADLYARGSWYVRAAKFQAALTSKELKVKPKSANVAGLQFADLVAYPAYQDTIRTHGGLPLADSFSGRIATILTSSKYRRQWGKIDGFGRVFLPR